MLFDIGTLLRFDGNGKSVSGVTIIPITTWNSFAGGPSGTIYTADAKNRIQQIDASGQISTIFNRDLDQYVGPQPTDSASNYTHATMNLAVDSKGNLFVADRTLNQIRELPAGSCNPPVQPQISALQAAPPLPTNQTGSSSATFAPGEIVTLYGSALGPQTGVAAAPSAGSFPTSAAGVQVLFEGIPAPILYASANQVNTIIPFSMYGYSTVRAELQFNGVLTDAFPLLMAPTAPAFFTYSAGNTVLPIVVNPDGSLNSNSNPAPAGS